MEGLELATENIPDLVISDVMMPHMDGMEMCSKLKSDERTSHIPVVMLTARADRGSKMEGLETGADDYIIKPFDPEELKVRVRNMIDQRKKLIEKFRKKFESDSTEAGAPPGDQFLERLMTILSQHLTDPEFNLAQLPDELHMSRAQMFRKVSAITGYTPKELIRNVRIKKAASLFRSGHHHVAQVMHQVGFNNQSYFGVCFRKLYGLTPTEYIRSNSSQAFDAE
jgi:YesN/AraC family two-component response regulator